jgi:uncharacterized protein (TIGR02246 family)
MTAEIEAVLRDQLDAWNRGDLRAFCASYTSDGVYLRRDGPVRGRDAIEALYRSRFGAAPGRLSVVAEEIEVRGDAAFVQVRWTLDGATGFALLGFRRETDGWKIAWDATP